MTHLVQPLRHVGLVDGRPEVVADGLRQYVCVQLVGPWEGPQPRHQLRKRRALVSCKQHSTEAQSQAGRRRHPDAESPAAHRSIEQRRSAVSRTETHLDPFRRIHTFPRSLTRACVSQARSAAASCAARSGAAYGTAPQRRTPSCRAGCPLQDGRPVQPLSRAADQASRAGPMLRPAVCRPPTA